MAPKSAISSKQRGKKSAVVVPDSSDLDNAAPMQEDVTPLNFDTEEELMSVLSKLREDLQRRVKGRCEEEGMRKKKDKVEKIVIEQFFGKMAPMITSNCSIGGIPYARYKKIKDQGKIVETQPFQEDLHEQVLRYQDQLFDARAENAIKRKELPQQSAEALREKLSRDRDRIAVLEKIASTPVEIVSADTPPAPTGKGRKSVSSASNAAVEAEENFTTGKNDLDKLLTDIPVLVTKVENAAQISADVAALK